LTAHAGYIQEITNSHGGENEANQTIHRGCSCGGTHARCHWYCITGVCGRLRQLGDAVLGGVRRFLDLRFGDGDREREYLQKRRLLHEYRGRTTLQLGLGQFGSKRHCEQRVNVSGRADLGRLAHGQQLRRHSARILIERIRARRVRATFGRNVGASFVSFLMLALVGCTAASPSEPTPTPVTVQSLYKTAIAKGYKAEAAALSDQKVTRPELASGVEAFKSCLERFGLQFNLIGTNPVDGWRPVYDVFWPGMSDSKGSSIASRCSASNLDLISAGYELTNTDQMDPSLMAGVLVCLKSTKFKAPAQALNLKDLIPLGDKDPNLQVVLDCVHKLGDHLPTGVELAY